MLYPDVEISLRQITSVFWRIHWVEITISYFSQQCKIYVHIYEWYSCVWRVYFTFLDRFSDASWRWRFFWPSWLLGQLLTPKAHNNRVRLSAGGLKRGRPTNIRPSRRGARRCIYMLMASWWRCRYYWRGASARKRLFWSCSQIYLPVFSSYAVQQWRRVAYGMFEPLATTENASANATDCRKTPQIFSHDRENKTPIDVTRSRLGQPCPVR